MNCDHGWTPLLHGDRQRKALEVVTDIVASLVAPGSEAPAAPAAAAMLLAYAARIDLFPDAESLATERLDAVVASLADGASAIGLWDGIAGVGWSVAHLADGDDADEVCAVVEDTLLHHLDTSEWTGDYDLISGLVGIGVATLERLDAPAAQQVAGRVLDHLEAAARDEVAGLAWFTPAARLPDWQREICPGGYYNLGLAHGVPGIVGLMAGFVAAGFEVSRARHLLDGAVRWLRTTVPPSSPARFPSWWGPGIDDSPARLGWCYGDPGVAVTLLAAARALDDTGIEAEAIAMGHAMATRTLESSGVVDMGICHGAAGVAHIFNRMYQATGDAVLGEAARTWIDRLLAMRRDGAAIAGFPALRSRDDQRSWEPDGGIIVGASGVALVLLAAATEVEPAWDRGLLMDVCRDLRPGGIVVGATP